MNSIAMEVVDGASRRYDILQGLTESTAAVDMERSRAPAGPLLIPSQRLRHDSAPAGCPRPLVLCLRHSTYFAFGRWHPTEKLTPGAYTSEYEIQLVFRPHAADDPRLSRGRPRFRCLLPVPVPASVPDGSVSEALCSFQISNFELDPSGAPAHGADLGPRSRLRIRTPREACVACSYIHLTLQTSTISPSRLSFVYNA